MVFPSGLHSIEGIRAFVLISEQSRTNTIRDDGDRTGRSCR